MGNKDFRGYPRINYSREAEIARVAVLRQLELDNREDVLKNLGVRPVEILKRVNKIPTPAEAETQRRANIEAGLELDDFSLMFCYDLVQVLGGAYQGADVLEGVYRFSVNCGYVDSIGVGIFEGKELKKPINEFLETKGWRVNIDYTRNGDGADYYLDISVRPVETQ